MDIFQSQIGDVPVPSDTGATGTQQQGSTDLASLDVTPPTQGLLQVIEGLAANRPKSFGGEVPAAFVAGSFAHLTHDLNVTRNSLQKKDEHLQNVQEQLANANVTIAKLKERVGAASSVQRLKQFSIFVGTALLGVSVDLYKNNLQTFSYLLLVLGGALLAFGWLTNRAGNAE